MLVCIAASTIAISTFLISQNRTYLFTVFFFLFYFFDLVLIFQSEYLNHGTLIPLDSYYGIEQPLLKTVFAVGILESIWLIVCDYLNKRSLTLKIAPAAAFVVASFLIVMLMPEGDWKQWCFYSLREAFFVWCLAYSFAQYRRTGSAVEHARLSHVHRRRRWFCIASRPSSSGHAQSHRSCTCPSAISRRTPSSWCTLSSPALQASGTLPPRGEGAATPDNPRPRPGACCRCTPSSIG